MMEEITILAAELSASCAGARKGNNSSTIHTSEVNAFHTLRKILLVVDEMDASAVRQVQPILEKSLKEIICGIHSTISHSPAIYPVVGDLHVAILNKGDGRRIVPIASDMFDSVIKVSSAPIQSRIAALLCLEKLASSENGRLLNSFYKDIMAIATKTYKNIHSTNTDPNEHAFRFQLVSTLRALLAISGTTATSAHAELLRFTRKHMMVDCVPSVRSYAADICVTLCIMNSFTTIGTDMFLEILRRGVADKAFDVRMQHAQALGHILCESVLTYLNQEHEKSQNGMGKDELYEKGAPVSPTKAAKKGMSGPSGWSEKLRAMPAFSRSQAKAEPPLLLSFENACSLLFEEFSSVRPPTVPSNTGAAVSELRIREVQMAYTHAASYFIRQLMQSESKFVERDVMLRNGIDLAVQLGTSVQSVSDVAFKRSICSYYISNTFIADTTESNKIEIARILLSRCSESCSEGNVRRSSRSIRRHSLSPTASQMGKSSYPHAFLSASLAQVTAIVSCLGDAAGALSHELELQHLLTYLGNDDPGVRLETCSLLHVCAITQPGYASQSVIPILQLLGMYHAEIAVALSNSGGSHFLGQDSDSERSLLAMDGLVHGLCALVMSATTSNRPAGTSALKFLKDEGFSQPYVKGQVDIGDLKDFASSASLALLGYAKSLISRQQDGALKPHATIRVATCGWNLIGALVTLGNQWCATNLSQLFQAWQASVDDAVSVLQRNLDENFSRVAVKCLQASLMALLFFLRCNQVLVHETKTIARACMILVEQIVKTIYKGEQHFRSLPHFSGLFSVLCEVCLWLPRDELRAFKASAIVPLAAFAKYTFLTTDEAARTSLLETMLSGSDDVIDDSATPAEQKDCDITQRAKVFDAESILFESRFPMNANLEILFSTLVLNEDEMRRSLLDGMCRRSTNFSVFHVAGSTSTKGDNLASIGMMLAHSPIIEIQHIDAAVSFMGVALSQLFSPNDTNNVIGDFVQALKSLAKYQAVILANCMTVLAIAFDLIDRSGSRISQKRHSWVRKVKGILCVAVGSPRTIVRRGAVQLIGILGRVCDEMLVASIVNTLKARLVTTDEPAAAVSPFAQSGIAMSFASLRRDAAIIESKYAANIVVYDTCKQTQLPTRIWGLHAWNVIMECQGADVEGFVKPSIALINAHLLSMEGHPTRCAEGAQRAYGGVLVCLARIMSTIIVSLGPELSQPRIESHRFMNIWMSFAEVTSSQQLQLECIKIVQQILMFQPQLILGSNSIRDHVVDFLMGHILSLKTDYRNGDCTKVSLDALKLMLERDPTCCGSTFSPGKLALATCELSNKRAIFEDWILPPMCSSGIVTKLALESTFRNVSEPMMYHRYFFGGNVSHFSFIAGMEARAGLRNNHDLRQSCLRFLREAMDPAIIKNPASLSMGDLNQIISQTEHFWLYRGVLTGTKTTPDQGVPPDTYDESEEENSDEETADTKQPAKVESDSSLVAITPWENKYGAIITDVMANTCWETRTLAGEAIVHLFGQIKKIPSQLNIVEAKKHLQQLRVAPANQFICMQLRHLISGACQAANGTIQNAEIPHVSIFGYLLLMEVVRNFSKFPDPHDKTASILKAYQFELMATLGTGLGTSVSPILLPFASAFGLELFRQMNGIPSGRILNLLLPDELHSGKNDDDSDSDNETKGNISAMDSYPPYMQLYVIVTRLGYIARLWLSTLGDHVSHAKIPASTFASLSEIYGQSGKKSKKKRTSKSSSLSKSTKEGELQAAFARYFEAEEFNDNTTLWCSSLLNAWRSVIQDFSILSITRPAGTVLAAEALALSDIEDASGMPQILIDNMRLIVRAMSTLAQVPSVPFDDKDAQLLVSCSLQLWQTQGDACPEETIKYVLASIGSSILSRGVGQLRKSLILSIVHFGLVSFDTKDESSRRVQEEMEHKREMMKFSWENCLAPLLESRALQYHIDNHGVDVYHKIATTVLSLLPPYNFMEPPMNQDVEKMREEAMFAVECFPLLAEHCPAKLCDQYIPLLMQHCFRIVSHVDRVDYVERAGGVLTTMLNAMPQWGKELARRIPLFCDEMGLESNLDSQRVKYGLYVLCFHNLMFVEEMIAHESLEKRFLALDAVREMLEADKVDLDAKRKLLTQMGAQIFGQLVKRWEEPTLRPWMKSIPELLGSILISACRIDTSMVPLAIVILVSSLEVSSGSTEMRNIANQSLFLIVQTFPDHVRTAVASMPQTASAIMQQAVRQHMAATETLSK